jgi:predicted ArsR family transcriptional regulator
MLTEVIRTGETPIEVGRRVGRRGTLGGPSADDPVAGVVDQMARLGFEPDVTQTCGSVRIVLKHCPFASAALTDPDTVCGLHLGIAYGLAERLGGLSIDELRPKDPRSANCVLRCHTTPAA